MLKKLLPPQLNEQIRVGILGDLFTNWLKEQINKLEIIATLGDEINSPVSPIEIFSEAS